MFTVNHNEKLSARHFADPLILALGNLSGMTPGVAIGHKDACDAVCGLMGIAPDQYGQQDGTGVNWTERWAQWAFTDMTKVEPPLTERKGRGKWALTPEGVAKAMSFSEGAEIDDPIINDDDIDPVSTFTAPDVIYHHDPYIRTLAINETKCFGLFTAGSQTCRTCPIQSFCQNAKASILSDMAKAMVIDANTTLGDITAQILSGVETPTQVREPKLPPEDRISGVTVVNHMTTACKRCGKVANKADQVVWVKKPNNKAGFYHPHCYQTMVEDGEANPVTTQSTVFLT